MVAGLGFSTTVEIIVDVVGGRCIDVLLRQCFMSRKEDRGGDRSHYVHYYTFLYPSEPDV